MQRPISSLKTAFHNVVGGGERRHTLECGGFTCATGQSAVPYFAKFWVLLVCDGLVVELVVSETHFASDSAAKQSRRFAGESFGVRAMAVVKSESLVVLIVAIYSFTPFSRGESLVACRHSTQRHPVHPYHPRPHIKRPRTAFSHAIHHSRR